MVVCILYYGSGLPGPESPPAASVPQYFRVTAGWEQGPEDLKIWGSVEPKLEEEDGGIQWLFPCFLEWENVLNVSFPLSCWSTFLSVCVREGGQSLILLYTYTAPTHTCGTLIGVHFCLPSTFSPPVSIQSPALGLHTGSNMPIRIALCAFISSWSFDFIFF